MSPVQSRLSDLPVWACVGRSMSTLRLALSAFLRAMWLLTDSLMGRCPRSTQTGHRQPGQAGPQVYWGLHTRTLTASHSNDSYSGHHGGLCHPRRAQRQWVLASPPAARTLRGPSSRPAEEGRGCWGGPGLAGMDGRAGVGSAGLGGALTPATAASAAASAPSSGWSPGSPRPGTSHPPPCRPGQGREPG